MKKYSFTGQIQKVEDMDAGFIEIPEEISMNFGGRGRVKVQAEIGGVPYRGSLVRMEKNGPLLLIAVKDVRKKAGIGFNQPVAVTVAEDLAPRVAEIPAVLEKHFKKNRTAAAYFKTLAYTHQKEYAQWVAGAKKAETAESRAVKTIAMLQADMAARQKNKKK